MSDFVQERHKPPVRAGSAAGTGRGLPAHAEQRESVADRPGGRLLRRAADDLLRQRQGDRQDRPRRRRGPARRGPSHAAAGAGEIAWRGFCDRRPGADEQRRSIFEFAFPAADAYWWWATSGAGIEDEVLAAAGPRGRDSRLRVPYAHNAATAAAMALYEYCRQYPRG